MPRQPLIRSVDFPYHVTARANNRENFFCDLDTAWDAFNQHLNTVCTKNEAKVHAFVLMPNHFHLLISTPKDDLGKTMQRLMGSVTKTLNRETSRSGRVFGAKYHRTLITHDAYLDTVVKYIYRNPVKARLASKVENYDYSTLKTKLNISQTIFPLSPVLGLKTLIPNEKPVDFLEWLNKPFQSEQEIAIKQGFVKGCFELPKTTWARSDWNLAHYKKLT